MEKIVTILGLMFCLYVLLEILTRISKTFDNTNVPNFIISLLALLILILMVCTAPIGIFMAWRDKRIEKIHIDLYEQGHHTH